MREAWVEIYLEGTQRGPLARLHFDAPENVRHEEMEVLVGGIQNSFRNAGLAVSIEAALENKIVRKITAYPPPVEPPAPDPVKAILRTLEDVSAKLSTVCCELQASREARESRRPRKTVKGRRRK